MKAFEQEPKVNFIDENNICVGFDTAQNCCEDAGWYVADSPTPDLPDTGVEPRVTEWPGFVFDTQYDAPDLTSRCDWLEDGGIVVFRLTKLGESLYLHLYNCHNGYYSHGFDFTDGTTILKNGNL